MRPNQRIKLLRFIACEVIALVMLLASAIVGVREEHAHPTINPIVTALTILAAVGVGIIPVIFYGPRLLVNSKIAARAGGLIVSLCILI